MSRNYTPNSPQGRLQWVLRTYEPVNPLAALCCCAIACGMMGHDRAERVLGQLAAAALREGADGFRARAARGALRAWIAGDASDRDVALLYEGAYGGAAHGIHGDDLQLAPLPRHYEHDHVFQWVARELHRARQIPREIADEMAHVGAYDSEHLGTWLAYERLSGRCTAVAQWAQAERVDLMRISIEQALQEIDSWERPGAAVPAGEVVFAWPDGWTMQRLTTPEQLTAEGATMQHCVGSYAHDVQRGKSEIFSLRGPTGKPHVTIEWDTRHSTFEQVYGRQNATPLPEYAARVVAWMQASYPAGTAFHGALLAGMSVDELAPWVMASIAPERAMQLLVEHDVPMGSLRAWFVRSIPREQLLPWLVEAGEMVDWTEPRPGDNLLLAWHGIVLMPPQAERLPTSNFSYRGVYVPGRRAVIDRLFAFSQFRECVFRGARFRNLHWCADSAEACDFRGAAFHGGAIAGTRFIACDMRGLVIEDVALSRVWFDRCDLTGATLMVFLWDAQVYEVGTVTFTECRLDSSQLDRLVGRLPPVMPRAPLRPRIVLQRCVVDGALVEDATWSTP